MSTVEQATLGGGCFWCLDAIYRQLRGVESVESGYAGGHTKQPDYESVCQGDTGHAEVVRLQFQPDIISFEQILEIFFAIHDPTTLNRQGHDVGSQYRSVIFFHDEQQRQLAQAVMNRLAAAEVFDAPIVTELANLTSYYKAEDDHQDYYANNPAQGYCAFVVGPKVAKFRNRFLELLKD